eukprot:359793-Chlamydomonas_euryale.AAC.6
MAENGSTYVGACICARPRCIAIPTQVRWAGSRVLRGRGCSSPPRPGRSCSQVRAFTNLSPHHGRRRPLRRLRERGGQPDGATRANQHPRATGSWRRRATKAAGVGQRWLRNGAAG